MDRFEGFADDEGKFFRALAKNQQEARVVPGKHKAAFEEGWAAPMKLLVAELVPAIDDLYPHCDLGEPKVFRIFRDVRFSKDKSPYKTHIGAYVPTKKSGTSMGGPAAIYVHVGAKERFAGSGYYEMDGPDLARFRAAVADDAKGKELVKILARLAKKGFTVASHGEATGRGAEGLRLRKHPRAGLLKYKGLIATFPKFPKARLLVDRKLLPWLVKGAKDVAPLVVEWLVFATA